MVVARTAEGNLAMICSLIERGGLDRKSKLESTGRLCHVSYIFYDPINNIHFTPCVV